MTESTLEPVEYTFEQKGPWTVVCIQDWNRYHLGQSTAVEVADTPAFNRVAKRNTFFSLFPVRSVHEADQVHGAGLRDVGPSSGGHLDCDGLTTARSKAMLTMRTADCYPVFIKGIHNHRLGLVHAGWRGLRDQIVRKALDSWFREPVNLILGAGIAPERYEVSDDVVDSILSTHQATESELTERGILRGDCLNLRRLILYQCESSNCTVRSIRRLPLDTGEDEPVPMYSYRGTQTDRRMVSWIYREPQ